MSFAGFGRSRIPFDMFDLSRSADDARRLSKLGNLYHRGQELAWDGRAVLAELLARHGGIHLPEDKRAAMAHVFGVIMWGELAAWKISAELADQLTPLEARLAATSQAHDEARHFYVMYDYLTALGQVPTTMDRASRGVLDLVLETDSLANKLLGMQLMIETTALTIFQAVRESRIEPVLADLLRYYEKDEARHVGLGVQMLPTLIARMSKREGAALFLFQLQVIGWTIAGLKSLEPHFHALGIDARRILELGRAKQTLAFNQLWEQMGLTQAPKPREHVFRVINGVTASMFRGPGRERGVPLAERWQGFLDGFRADPYGELGTTALSPDEPVRPVSALH
jgi:hypothetical protein